MSVPHDHYNSNHMKRKFGPNWTRDPGCQNQSLFNIHLEDTVLDELHLMLRVTDRLEKGLILEVIDWDQESDYIYNIYLIEETFTRENCNVYIHKSVLIRTL